LVHAEEILFLSFSYFARYQPVAKTADDYQVEMYCETNGRAAMAVPNPMRIVSARSRDRWK
jgi:hypothetical protein